MVEIIKAFFTYATAAAVGLGGMFAVYQKAADPQAVVGITTIAGFVGLALGFLFGQQSAGQATRAATQASTQGAVAATNAASVAATPVANALATALPNVLAQQPAAPAPPAADAAIDPEDV